MKPKDIFEFIKNHVEDLTASEREELANHINPLHSDCKKPKRKKKQDHIPSVEEYKQMLLKTVFKNKRK